MSAIDFELDDECFWVARVQLTSWRAFHCDTSTVGMGADGARCDARVLIVFAPEGRGIEPLTGIERAAVDWVVANERAQASAVLSAVLAKYRKLQDVYRLSGDACEELKTNVSSVDGLKGLVKLVSINVHQVFADGIPYVGYEFECCWDRSGGLGVLMHGSRCVEIGPAYSAFLLWLAEADAKRRA